MVEEWIILWGNEEAIIDLHMDRICRMLETEPKWRRLRSEWVVHGKWRVQANISSVLSEKGGREMGHHPEDGVGLRDGVRVELIIICLYANGNDSVRE